MVTVYWSHSTLVMHRYNFNEVKLHVSIQVSLHNVDSSNIKLDWP